MTGTGCQAIVTEAQEMPTRNAAVENGLLTALDLVVADLADRGHLGGGAGEPALFEAFQFFQLFFGSFYDT